MPHTLARGEMSRRGPAAGEQLENLLISGLVLAQRRSLSEDLHDGERPLRPRTVNRVLELIESEPARPFNLGDLAEHTGVSARRLQQSFGEHLGMTPIKLPANRTSAPSAPRSAQYRRPDRAQRAV